MNSMVFSISYDNVMVTENPDGTTTISGSWDIGDEADGQPSILDFVLELQNTDKGEDTSLYFNLHSVGDPAGVIRGQIQAVPEPLTILGTGLTLVTLPILKKVRKD